jgi:hypothetical protein
VAVEVVEEPLRPDIEAPELDGFVPAARYCEIDDNLEEQDEEPGRCRQPDSNESSEQVALDPSTA